MTWYDEKRLEIQRFAKEQNMKMYDVARIAKDMATCDKCAYYCQHYDRDGAYVEFGHCNRGKHHARKPHEASCAFWEYAGDAERE